MKSPHSRLPTYLLFLPLLLAGIILALPSTRSQLINLLSESDCDSPLSYKLGTLDARFGLSQARALDDLKQSAAIWDNAYGKSLFTESAGAALTVNFVYDARTALNQKISQEQNQLNQKNTSLQKQVNTYETDVANFEKKLADFNAQVEQINRSGGASGDQYNNLVAQQNDLKTQGDALNVRARALNLATNNYNANVGNLNQNVNQFNEAVTLKPEEGVFDGTSNTIDIYFANNPAELTHTLAHEFGHSLGMQHVDDSQAIMYFRTTQFVKVTPQDKAELLRVCQKQILTPRRLQTITASRDNLFNSLAKLLSAIGLPFSPKP